MSPRTRLRLLAVPAAVLAGLLVPPAAHAGWVAAEALDGPSPDIVRMGDMDISRDGTGVLAYVRRDEGAEHVVVSRLVDGGWTAPERIDVGLPDGASPAVAASDGGRVAVAWVSGGAVWASVRDHGAAGFSPPQGLADGASAPSMDMSVGGVGYVSFTAAGAGGGDVRVARLDRRTSAFRLLPDVLDIDAANGAGLGTGRSQIAVAADGTAVAVWGENGRVVARRIFDDRVSLAPQDMTADVVEGRTGRRTADLPEIDIEDDSSFAWATFRQRFDDGRLHVVARRLVGLGVRPARGGRRLRLPRRRGRRLGADRPQRPRGGHRRDGRRPGRGLLLAPARGRVLPGRAARVRREQRQPGRRDRGQQRRLRGLRGRRRVAARAPVRHRPAVAQRAAARARGRPVHPGLRPVDEGAGIDLAVDRGGNMAVAVVQGSGAERRLVVASFDRAPGSFTTYSTSKLRRSNRPTSPAGPFELWGPLRYRVEVAGRSWGRARSRGSCRPRRCPTASTAGGSWRSTAAARSPPRRSATCGSTPGRRRSPRRCAAAAGGSCASPPRWPTAPSPRPPGSGVRTSRCCGATARGRRAARYHRYRRGGEYTVTVRATTGRQRRDLDGAGRINRK
jgi:hypothetical protein